MNPLQRIQQRIESYERTVESRIKEFQDEKTMTYFSDRFGPDHPMSARADRGVHLQNQLAKMRERVGEFASKLLAEFPHPDSEIES